MDNMQPNDLANLLTVGAAALGSILLIVFKSRCTKINLCYLFKCERDVASDNEDDNESLKKKEKPKEIRKLMDNIDSSIRPLNNIIPKITDININTTPRSEVSDISQSEIKD